MNQQQIDREVKTILFSVVRTALHDHFAGVRHRDFTELKKKHPLLSEPHGVFITLRLNHALRGCIGSIEPEHPLIDAVYENACSSAFHDPRFAPVSTREAADLEYEITILGDLVLVKNFDEITVGRDGLYIKKRFHGGVFLPQVPVEQHWDRTMYLAELLHKAGLASDTYQRGGYELFRFEGLILTE